MIFITECLDLFDHRNLSGMDLVGILAFLVGPVSGDAILGGFVHRPASDLNLQLTTAFSEYRSVKRPISVALGASDVILESSLKGNPETVDHTE